jgi:hypothetical protein
VLELNPFTEDRWTTAEARRWISLGVSAVLHVAILLLLVFGLPISRPTSGLHASAEAVPQAIAMPLPPLSRKHAPPQAKPKPRPVTPAPPPPPPPPPMKEVELGPDSKKPDAPAKEAAAAQSDADIKGAPAAEAKVAPPPAAPSQPPAPQRILVPHAGDFANKGPALPIPTTSPWAPPALDSASGAPEDDALASDAAPMGRAGLANRDPDHWKNSFDDETSGRCVKVPDFGRNPDGSPVLAAVLGRVLDTDGQTPLSGAHLQIEGTEFGTFTDANGNYRLSFDPKLLAQCRKQYVDVVAPGYRGEHLTLMIGPRVRSPDVVLHH